MGIVSPKVEIEIAIRFNVSWWDAIKMRLAGANVIREWVRQQLEKRDA